MDEQDSPLHARLDALESVIAGQQRDLDDLNATVIKQWAELDLCASQIKRLHEEINTLQQNNTQEPPLKPPHY